MATFKDTRPPMPAPADGKTIPGAWEICHDGRTWEHDFDLTYTKE